MRTARVHHSAARYPDGYLGELQDIFSVRTYGNCRLCTASSRHNFQPQLSPARVFSKSFMLSDPDLIPFDPPAHPLVGWPGRRTFVCNRDYIIAMQELPAPPVALCRSRGAVAQQIP